MVKCDDFQQFLHFLPNFLMKTGSLSAVLTNTSARLKHPIINMGLRQHLMTNDFEMHFFSTLSLNYYYFFNLVTYSQEVFCVLAPD